VKAKVKRSQEDVASVRSIQAKVRGKSARKKKGEREDALATIQKSLQKKKQQPQQGLALLL